MATKARLRSSSVPCTTCNGHRDVQMVVVGHVGFCAECRERARDPVAGELGGEC